MQNVIKVGTWSQTPESSGVNMRMACVFKQIVGGVGSRLQDSSPKYKTFSDLFSVLVSWERVTQVVGRHVIFFAALFCDKKYWQFPVMQDYVRRTWHSSQFTPKDCLSNFNLRHKPRGYAKNFTERAIRSLFRGQVSSPTKKRLQRRFCHLSHLLPGGEWPKKDLQQRRMGYNPM